MTKEKIPSAPENQGEGNVKAARNYNRATQGFVKTGRVQQAAQEAAPTHVIEAAEMVAAEKAGRSRAKK
jgi:hypothetical protein